ncbi:hypothetical protein FACHB389_10685 [Nostoc calcicola FACHB-389]|nr:hypothetical protein [Nostoc calcicola FACHB-3891]OKH36971.1 hypothetical protein FACHB389_10685 [Nostoc calcicola FACHB-389]
MESPVNIVILNDLPNIIFNYHSHQKLTKYKLRLTQSVGSDRTLNYIGENDNYSGSLPFDGEPIIIEIIQDNEGLKKVHFGSAFIFPSNILPDLNLEPHKRNFIYASWCADLNKWMITNILKGI